MESAFHLNVLVGVSPANLPVLGLALEHHGILRLADVAIVVLFDILGALLSLYPIILREGALVAGAAGVREEVRSDGLNRPLRRVVLCDLSEELEVLVGGPTLWEGRQRESNHFRSHFCA